MKLAFIILLLSIIIFGIYFISTKVTRKNDNYQKPDSDPIPVPEEEHVIKGVPIIIKEEGVSKSEDLRERVILTGTFESAKTKVRKEKREKTEKEPKKKEPTKKSSKRKYTPRKKKKGDKGDDLLLS